MTITAPYASGRTYFDADSHVVETPEWLAPFADPAIRDRIRDLDLGKGGGELASKALARAQRRAATGGPALRDDETVMSAKGWAALGAFDTVAYTNRLGLDVRADRLETLTATLAGIAAPLHAWYGVRVFTDTAPDGAAIPDDLEPLLAAEERAGRTDPYRRVAALLHLCGVRG